jgi:hypothetical protein
MMRYERELKESAIMGLMVSVKKTGYVARLE